MTIQNEQPTPQEAIGVTPTVEQAPRGRVQPWFSWVPLLLLYSLTAPFTQAGEPSRIRTLAILDLKSPEAVPWLGTAVAEAVRVKLNGVDGIRLVEREAMKPLVTATKDNEVSPERVGAEYLLTGSVQLIGGWGSPDAKVRISAKVVTTQTAQLENREAIVL
ncbi:MAG: hypothetical protein ACYTGH_16515, partial [Planctomycetota bacterium]